MFRFLTFIRRKQSKTTSSPSIQLPSFADVEQTRLLSIPTEIVLSDNLHDLEHDIQSHIGGNASQFDTLVVGMAENLDGVVNRDEFLGLVNLTPEIKRIVLLPVDKEDNAPWPDAPEPARHLLPLPFLLDATIMSATTSGPSNATKTLLQDLPKGLKFLQAPGNPNISPDATTHPPEFQLYGFTAQDYSSRLATWALSKSRSSLQCLTVERAADLGMLGHELPSLRSLRILGVNSTPVDGMQSLDKLERLEIRARSTPGFTAQTLPNTLRCFRFWSSQIAKSLVAFLALPNWKQHLPHLNLVIWDFWNTRSGIEDTIRKELVAICKEVNLELRVQPRVEHGERASPVCLRTVLS